MRKLTGIVSLFGAFYMMCLLTIENFAYQAGAISLDEWHYKCLVLLMCVVITWLSFSGDNNKCSENNTVRMKSQNICENLLTTTR